MFFSQLKDFLIPFQEATTVPTNAYVIYDMSGGKYYVLHRNYEIFMSAYLSLQKKNHLTLDLNSAVYHAVCFDIDGSLTPQQIDYYIDYVLVPVLKDFFITASFSVLVTQKSLRGGMHVFLPDLRVSNDDYEWLCSLLKTRLHHSVDNAITLDFPKNFNLPYASKVNDQHHYEPSAFILVSEHDMTPIKLCLGAANHNMESVKKMLNKTPKKNSLKHLAFVQFVNQVPQSRYIILGRLMSPINCYHALKVQDLSFVTTIKDSDDEDREQNDFRIAKFEYIEDEICVLKYMYKRNSPSFTSQPQSNTYHYIKSQIFRIGNLESSLLSVRQWWARNTQRLLSPSALDDIFQDLNLRLKRDNKFIRDMTGHPIKSILTFKDGLFFMPVFYALCNEVKANFETLCDRLLDLLGADHAALNRISTFSGELVKSVSEKYSYQTILYCAGNMHKPVGDLLSKIKLIIDNEAVDMQSTILLEQMVRLMCHIVTTYFPIHRNEKDKKFIWNPVQGKWLAVTREDDIRCVLSTVTDCLLTFYEQNFDRRYQYTSFAIRDKCYSIITSKNFMEDDYLSLDFRYWLLRTNEGCLDLLTLNTSAVVPEQFLSEKTILPKFCDISTHIHDAQLRQVYRQLWSRSFFDDYVQKLKSGDGDYLRTLREMTMSQNDTTDALLHAYTHLCKYLRFNYEEMRYFLHVLATGLIATNYGKYLFILQGVKNNGKSRFFNILRQVFGQYQGVVDNETLSLSHKSDLKPEIVKNVYSCRIITTEEFHGLIHENFLKSLTGNCMLSARTLYETNAIGIPTSKFFVATNKPPAILVTEAFKERISVFNFSAKFIPNLSLSIANQIESGQFKVALDETILKDTALGFFLHMIYLLEENISLEDGFLHYPPVPESLVAFKESYLKITNTYFQFKVFMDIQIVKGETTTLSELKSAIRHFLRLTKNNMYIDEKEINDQFDLEFKSNMFYPEEEFLNSDDNDDDDEGGGDDELLQQSRAKKSKKSPSTDKTDNLCYSDIVIKNLIRRK